jgi:NADPH:quinone reductase-like Zn-dependent oxidoreductase
MVFLPASAFSRSLTISTYTEKITVSRGSLHATKPSLACCLAMPGAIHPVIDRTYPLEQIAGAHRYDEPGYKKGRVIITAEHNGKTNE